MSRSAIPRRAARAGGFVLIAAFVVGFSAITSGLPAKMWSRVTGAEHALMLSRSTPDVRQTALLFNDRDVPLTPVPEPGVIASLIGGVALLLSLRRRG